MSTEDVVVDENINNISDITEMLKELSAKELSRIKKFGNDYLVPVRLAAKIKGLAPATIYYAIERGDLKRVNGVLLSSLISYNVNKENQKNAIKGIKVKKGQGLL